MKDNYPPGAANDPNAPYNEVHGAEVDVLVRTVMVKGMVLESSDAHLVDEWEVDCDGGYTHQQFMEHGDLKEDYRNQWRTLRQALEACCKVLQQLVNDGQRSYAGVYITKLLEEGSEWDDDEFTVEEE